MRRFLFPRRRARIAEAQAARERAEAQLERARAETERVAAETQFYAALGESLRELREANHLTELFFVNRHHPRSSE